MRLVLASSSPRRKELLERVGLFPEICPAEIDESARPGESPREYVTRLAAAKADAVFAAQAHFDRWVLGADTIVEIDGAILGKASDPAGATAMLERLLGRSHRVSTAFSLRGGKSGIDRLVTTEVLMRTAAAGEIAEYVRSGEWRGKAGAYAVQGMAAALVTEVRGSISNVVGLPLAEVIVELSRLGLSGPHYTRGVAAT